MCREWIDGRFRRWITPGGALSSLRPLPRAPTYRRGSGALRALGPERLISSALTQTTQVKDPHATGLDARLPPATLQKCVGQTSGGSADDSRWGRLSMGRGKVQYSAVNHVYRRSKVPPLFPTTNPQCFTQSDTDPAAEANSVSERQAT